MYCEVPTLHVHVSMVDFDKALYMHMYNTHGPIRRYTQTTLYSADSVVCRSSDVM